jgi:long-subunit acyl-CoA synthetase (AMP-forming)
VWLWQDDDAGMVTMAQLKAMGEALPEACVLHEQPSDLTSLICTSGSTGKPKAAVMTSRKFLDYQLRYMRGDFDPFVTYFNTVTDRKPTYSCFLSGGRCAMISCSANLFQDIRQISPTYVSATPRFWQVINARN